MAIAASVLVVVAVNQAMPKNTREVLGKPLTFGVEKISVFRSQDIKPEWGRPVVDGDRIVVASSRKYIDIFDSSGNKLNQFHLDFAAMATPAIKGNALFVGGDDGKFHSLNLDDGSQIWDYDLKTIGFSDAALTEDGSLVIFQTAGDRVMALDASSGQWRWEYQHLRFADLAIQGLSKPAISEGIAYVGFSSGSVAAFEAATGRGLWKNRVFTGEQFTDVDAPIRIGQTNIYVVSVSGAISAVSKKTGNIIWTYLSGGMGGCCLMGDNIYLASDEAQLISIDKVTGKPAWTTDLTRNEKTEFVDMPLQPEIINGYIVLVNRYGNVIVADPKTGEIVQRKNYHTETSAPITSFDDSHGFLFMDNKGLIRLWPGIAGLDSSSG